MRVVVVGIAIHSDASSTPGFRYAAALEGPGLQTDLADQGDAGESSSGPARDLKVVTMLVIVAPKIEMRGATNQPFPGDTAGFRLNEVSAGSRLNCCDEPSALNRGQGRTAGVTIHRAHGQPSRAGGPAAVELGGRWLVREMRGPDPQ